MLAAWLLIDLICVLLFLTESSVGIKKGCGVFKKTHQKNKSRNVAFLVLVYVNTGGRCMNVSATAPQADISLLGLLAPVWHGSTPHLIY